MSSVRFIHIGDVHIIDSRRDEYKEVFNRLYESVKSEISKVNVPCIIVVPGDIYDTKTKVSSNNIKDVKEFLYNLQLLAHTVIIPGNHDLQVSKPGSPDLLSPTVSNSSNLTNLTFYRSSGIYKIPGYDYINFVVSAPDDFIYQRDNPIVFTATGVSEEIVRQKGELYISLMHEEIAGSSAFGYSFSGTRFDGTRVTKEDFSNCDLVMLNHVHQRQLLTERAGYAGSLIQKNFGEYHHGHGYYIWDVDLPTENELANVRCQTIDIINPRGFLTIKYKQDIDITEEPIPLTPNSVRIEYTNCTENFINGQLEIVKAKYGHIKNVRCLDAPKEIANVAAEAATDENNNNNPPIQHNDKENILKASEDVASIETQINLISHLLKDNPLLESVIKMHKIKAAELLENNPGNAASARTRWRLLNIKFSNMFCYGPDNEVSFETLFNSVSGIIAKNKNGKSAFIDILMFTLYDELPRGNRSNILNHTYRDAGGAPASNYRVTLELEIDGKKATIVKSLINKSHPKLNFMFNGADLTQATTAETQKIINNYIGNYEDAINTSIVLQKGPDDFVYMKPDKRKLVLARLFNLSIFGELQKFAKEEQLRLKTVIAERTNYLKMFAGNISEEKLNGAIIKKQTLEAEIPTIKQFIYDLEQELSKLYDIWRDKNPVNVVEMVDSLTDDELVELSELEKADIAYNPRTFNTAEMPTKPRPVTINQYNGNITSTLNKLIAYGADKYEHPIVEIPKTKIIEYLQKIDINSDPDTLYFKDIVVRDIPYSTDKHKELNVKNIPNINYNEIINCLTVGKYKTHKDMPIEINSAIESYNKTYSTINLLYEKKVVKMPFEINDLNLSDTCTGCNNLRKIASESKDKEKLLNQYNMELENYNATLTAYKTKIQLQFQEFELLNTYKKLYIINLLKNYQFNLMVQLENILLLEKWKLYDEYVEFQAQFDQSLLISHTRRNVLREKASARRQILESNITDYRNKLILSEREYGEISNSIVVMNEKLQTIKTLQDELLSSKVNATLMELYREVLSEKHGIPMLLIKRIITAFSNSVNHTLAQFTDMQLVIDDELNIGVKVGAFHHPEPIEMGSGYQKFVVSLACRVALIYVSNTPLLNGLIIDEGFSSLDFENRELAVDFLKELGQYHELLFIISHLEALQVAMDRPLIIERRVGAGEYSYIRNTVSGEKLARPADFITDKEDPCKFYCVYCKKSLASSALAKHKISGAHLKKIHEAGF
jgi:DNA repair exonuclease SbcCD nuclease subunit/ABC-type molybdenum transport system ATPase subunit/photorepair protein PhrA